MTRLTIDELEILTPDQLRKILFYEISKYSPDVMYIQDLLDVGCPIDIRDEDDQTALYWAVGNSQLEVVEFLISAGAEVNARDKDGWTALHLAAILGKHIMVKLLLSKGADTHIETNAGYRAWYFANDETWEVCPELEPK